MIRTDPIGNWPMLMPAAKAGLCRRICLVGAESTGKTTLAEALAERWGSSWVPEVGRDYTLEKKAAGTNDDWTTDDFIAIAERQQRLEDHRARRSGPVMACDTDALTTALWHERYQGHRSPVVDALAARRRYDLFVLCGTDVPWQADEIRIDGSSGRDHMQQQIRNELALRPEPVLEVTGSVEARIGQIDIEIVRRQWLTADVVFDPARWR
jgi:HTH-type transcriptional regulator, transcriptional repressor of NAD biosynthesis genes